MPASGASPRPLPRRFFNRSPEVVARALLGQWLVRRRGRTTTRARIVETEAYLGTEDAAAHSARGRTARNAVLFGPPGHAYIYLSYGIHWCLNVSTLPAGRAGCVLLRALEPWPGARGDPRRFSGPGKLTRALDVDRRLNGRDLTRPGPLFLARGAPPAEVIVTPRVGITRSPYLPLRFYVAGSPAVSGPKRPRLRPEPKLAAAGRAPRGAAELPRRRRPHFSLAPRGGNGETG